MQNKCQELFTKILSYEIVAVTVRASLDRRPVGYGESALSASELARVAILWVLRGNATHAFELPRSSKWRWVPLNHARCWKSAPGAFLGNPVDHGAVFPIPPWSAVAARKVSSVLPFAHSEATTPAHLSAET